MRGQGAGGERRDEGGENVIVIVIEVEFYHISFTIFIYYDFKI